LKKVYNLSVKIGTYESEGKTRNRYKDIGSVFEGDRGMFMLLDKCFNPAGVETEAGRDSIMVSMFEPKDEGKGDDRKSKKFEDDIPNGKIPF